MFFTLDDVVRARGTVVTNALADDPRADREWAAANGIVSFVGYPLIVGERIVGVIAMFGRSPFSEATVQAISYIANAVASAIERDRSEAAQARLAAIVEATTDLVSIRMLDHSGPAYMNQAGRTMLGLGPQEPVPDLAAFRTEESLAEWTDVILPAALKDGLWAGETTFVEPRRPRDPGVAAAPRARDARTARSSCPRSPATSPTAGAAPPSCARATSGCGSRSRRRAWASGSSTCAPATSPGPR